MRINRYVPSVLKGLSVMTTNRKQLYSPPTTTFRHVRSPFPHTFMAFQAAFKTFQTFSTTKRFSLMSVIMTHFQRVNGSVRFETLFSHPIQGSFSLPQHGLRPNLSLGSCRGEAEHGLLSLPLSSSPPAPGFSRVRSFTKVPKAWLLPALAV